MYKQDLALNNPQWLTCHKIQPNQTKLPSLHETLWYNIITAV